MKDQNLIMPVQWQRAREFAPIVQVGIRSMSESELPFVERDRILYSHELYYDKKLYKKALDKLTGNVYITIDLDVFDPSIMPSTGTPEPGGPEYFELMHFLRDVIRTEMLLVLMLLNYVLQKQIKHLILLRLRLFTSCCRINLPHKVRSRPVPVNSFCRWRDLRSVPE